MAADCLSLIVTVPEIASNSDTTAGVIFQYTCTSPNRPGPRTRLGEGNNTNAHHFHIANINLKLLFVIHDIYLT